MGRSKKINKKYKDTVFRLLFGKDKNELLKLYNPRELLTHLSVNENSLVEV